MDVQQALQAERIFNNKNLILLTFHEHELNTTSIKQLHRSVKNVQFLQPEFIPKRRCIVEVKDKSDINAVKDILSTHQYSNNYLTTVNLIKQVKDSCNNIDPCKLLVKNLPISVSKREIKQLFPLNTEYSFLPPETKNTRNLLVHFDNVQEAISSYNSTNFICFKSNMLSVQFYRKKTNIQENSDTDFWDDSSCSESEFLKNKSQTRELKEKSDSEDDLSKWKKIENNSLNNKKVSDTLLVQNLPNKTSGEDILKLFPSCYRYKFVPNSEKRTKSVLVRFRKIEDAIKMYTGSDNIYKANILQIEFFYKDSDSFLSKKWFKNETVDKENRSSYETVDRFQDNQENAQEHSNWQKNSTAEKQKDKTVDPFILHVQNLPYTTTNEDLLELFPEHQQYQIIPEESTKSASSYVCFNREKDAFAAFKSNKNKQYKNKILSVKFKSKKLKINPFALMKRKSNTSVESVSKKVKRHEDSDDVILVGDVTNSHMKIITEDDVECKSEDEDFIDEVYIDPELETAIPEEEDVSDDNEFQGVELDDNTVLPLDEDDDF